MPNYNYSLLTDSHIKYPIFDLDRSFADYIAISQSIIRTHRQDLNGPNAEKIILANTPFELRPNTTPTTGALLIHGLLDCPFVMKDLGNSLQTAGLLTRSILLPGHGTVPGNLLHVTIADWLQALKYGIASFKQEVDHIFLIGFSTGASLVLQHCLETVDDPRIKGLVLLAPAIKINSFIDFATGWYQYFTTFWDRANWLTIADETDYTRYQSIAFNAAHQVYLLGKNIKRLSQTQALQKPILMVVSEKDETVSSKAAIKYFYRYANAESQLKCYPKKAKLCHRGLPISPLNTHYGKHGDYEPFFNPDFMELAKQINQFISGRGFGYCR